MKSLAVLNNTNKRKELRAIYHFHIGVQATKQDGQSIVGGDVKIPLCGKEVCWQMGGSRLEIAEKVKPQQHYRKPKSRHKHYEVLLFISNSTTHLSLRIHFVWFTLFIYTLACNWCGQSWVKLKGRRFLC